MEKVIAIIPARGGSKRLPRKNILSLGGVPLVSRVIRTAQGSGIFDDIIVSSEDYEILDIAQEEGVIAHSRPLQLASDRSTVVDTCIEALQTHPGKVFCCIYATAVMLSEETLRVAAEMFLSTKSSSVLMGVSKYNYHPVQALTVTDDGNAKLLFPKYKSLQSQFYPLARVSNGTFYWAKVDTFLKEKTFYSQSLALFDVPDSEVCDVDTEEDYLRLVELFKKSDKA
jgi:CMP-N-acetylneuraminic acid synthetase